MGLGKALRIPVKSFGRTGATLRSCLAASAAMAIATGAAHAQQPQPQPQPSGGPIGPPQLQDFQLEPRQRIVTQPRPAPQPQPTPAPTPPAAERTQQRAADPRPPADSPRGVTPAPRAPVAAAPPAGGTPREPAAEPTTQAPAAEALPPADFPAAAAPVPLPPAPAPAPAADAPPVGSGLSGGTPLWMILLGGLALGLVGYTLLTRRRSARRTLALPAPAVGAAAEPVAPRAPRPDPVPRPWLEVELVPERTTADPEESAVEFELRLHNKGGSTASNIKLQAKLFCSTPEQDKEIAAFHRKRPGEHRTLSIPDLPAGQELRLKGRVDIKRDQIKVLRVEDRLLFIPLVAVNAFYSWGSARSGQTSKSFLVGRERADAADKMAPFRMDLGPRVYRTVGQRPYAVERRV